MSFHPPLCLWYMDSLCWLWIKDPGFWNPVPGETSLCLLLWAQDQQLVRSKVNLLRQLSRDGNWHGLGMSRATAASPKPPFKASEMSGNAMVGSRNCRMDSIKMDISAHARTAHKGLQQESLEEDICWIVLHVPSMTQSVKGLNWTELNEIKTTKHTG